MRYLISSTQGKPAASQREIAWLLQCGVAGINPSYGKLRSSGWKWWAVVCDDAGCGGGVEVSSPAELGVQLHSPMIESVIFEGDRVPTCDDLRLVGWGCDAAGERDLCSYHRTTEPHPPNRERQS